MATGNATSSTPGCDLTAGPDIPVTSVLEGTLALAGHPPVALGVPPDWSADPFNDPTWRLQLHSLSFLNVLLADSLAEGTQASKQAVEAISQSWIEAHPTPDDTDVWNAHTVALRALSLVCVATVVESDLVREALFVQGTELANADAYAGAWNHGLDQNLALLATGACIEHRPFMDLAASRISDMLSTVVDDEGVTNEQSIHYQLYNFERLSSAADTLEEHGYEATAIRSAMRAMPELLAHATQPDQTYVPIGDTPPRLARPIPGTVAEFPASRGRTGSAPEVNHRSFRAGYSFARSGWGTERPFEFETFASLRYGPGRVIHGHNDHTSVTWFAGGEPIVVDPGFAGYADRARRAWLQSPAAHNVVFAGDRRFEWDATTRLVAEAHGDTWASYRVEDEPHVDASRSRCVFVHLDDGYLLVRDALTLPASSRVAQLWHLSPSFRVSAASDTFAHFSSSRQGLGIHQLASVDSLKVVEGRTDPYQGWVASVDDRAPRTTLRGLVPAPVVQSVVFGRKVLFVTLLSTQALGTGPAGRVTRAGVTLNLQLGPKAFVIDERGLLVTTDPG